MRHMVVIVPELTGYASIRRVAVSLPYAAQLIDGTKYMEPGDVKPPEGGTGAPPPACAARAVKCARWSSGRSKCDSAEQLGERLKRRYDRADDGAEGWHRLATPAPMPNLIASSARCSASAASSQRDMASWPRRSGIRCRRRHYHVTKQRHHQRNGQHKYCRLKIRHLPHGARPLGSSDGPANVSTELVCTARTLI